MSELNFSDAPVGEPLEIAEPAVDENVDLDSVDLASADEEAAHELDGFQVEEATELTREEADEIPDMCDMLCLPSTDSGWLGIVRGFEMVCYSNVSRRFTSPQNADWLPGHHVAFEVACK